MCDTADGASSARYETLAALGGSPCGVYVDCEDCDGGDCVRLM